MDKELMMAVVEAIERVARSNEAVEVQLMEIKYHGFNYTRLL